jgi:hypothetical protein
LAPKGLHNIKAIAAGDQRSLTLTEDGTVQVWGKGNPAPEGLTNVIAISAGGREDAALKLDGTVVDSGVARISAWISNGSVEFNVNSGPYGRFSPQFFGRKELRARGAAREKLHLSSYRLAIHPLAPNFRTPSTRVFLGRFWL